MDGFNYTCGLEMATSILILGDVCYSTVSCGLKNLRAFVSQLNGLHAS